MTDYAQELRRARGADADRGDPQGGLDPRAAGDDDRAGGVLRDGPRRLALERGSEANAPLARVILGGLLAGEPATLFVLPVLYSLMVRDKPGPAAQAPRNPHGGGDGGHPHGKPDERAAARTGRRHPMSLDARTKAQSS